MAIEKSSGYTGNIERVISLAKFPELAKETAKTPRLIADKDGVAYYKAEVVVAVDRHFPTKAGNETTTMVIIPLDGAKEFSFDGGKLKMDGIAPFIYGGRGISHVFTVLDNAGDVMKKPTTRRSAQAEIDALNKKLDSVMAALSALASK